MSIPPIRSELLANLRDPEKQKKYRAQGRAAVGGTAHNACAATASQPLIDLDILHHIDLLAEGLANSCKKTRRFSAVSMVADAQPGDLQICKDLNGNGMSDHVLWLIRDLGDGWWEVLDNQGSGLTHRRRPDGRDGHTPARGFLRLTS